MVQTDCSWRAVSSMILRTRGGFGLDINALLMDPTKLDLSELPDSYQNLFKVWSLFRVHRLRTNFLFTGYCRRAMILGARLDITSHCNLPGLSSSLRESRVFTLGHLLTLTGLT